jgi:hypothetical protein
MGFAAEMKDFSAGMSSAGKFWDQRADRKLKEAKAAQYKISDEDLANQPSSFTGGTGGTGMVPPPSGGGGGKYYDATDPADAQIGAARHAISDNESGSNYDALGVVIPKSGDRAYGKYQIMGNNIPSWTKQYLGQEMTPEEFLKNPEAQDKVFDGEFGRLADKYGWGGAAQAWLGGEGSVGKADRADPLGTSVGEYAGTFLKKFNQYGGGGDTMTAGTKPAPSTSRGAIASGAGEEGDGEDGDGEDDQGTDEGVDTSQAQQPAQPVQTAQAAPLVPAPEVGAIPTTPTSPAQFASVAGSGFGQTPQASQQPSQQAQPTQMAAVQPRSMSQGAGMSRVADAMMTPEEKAKQAALQKGALFADKGGVIPEVGTPTIQQYYARGGTVPKVEHQSTSEWIYDHLPAWLTGEEMGDTIRQTERGIGRPVIPERGQKEDMPRDKIKTDRRSQESMDMTSGPREPPPGKDQPPEPIETSRRQQESMDMTSGPREPPQVPVPPQTAAQQVSVAAPPVIPGRGQKEPNLPVVQPPDQPHTMTRALQPDKQAAPTATAPTQGPPQPTVAQRVSAQARPVIPERGQREPAIPPDIPPDRPTKDDTIEQTGPELPTAAGAPQQGVPTPTTASTTTPAPVASGAARAAATDPSLETDDYDPEANWRDAGDMSSYDRRSSRFEGQARQTPPGAVDVAPGYHGAIRPDEAPPAEPVGPKQGPNKPGQVGLGQALVRGFTPSGSGAPSDGTGPDPQVGNAMDPGATGAGNNPQEAPPPAPPSSGVLPEVNAGDAMDPGATGAAGDPQTPVQPTPVEPAKPGEIAGAIPVPGARPANPINGVPPVPQDRPDQPTRPRAPVTQVAASGTRTAPAPTTRHATAIAQPAPAGGQGRMLNAGSQSPRINAGSTAAQVRDSRPASPRYLVQHQGHDNPRTVAVAAIGAHHGLDFIRHIFGFDGSSNEAIPSGGGGNQVGARRFINGAGAATPKDNAAIDKIANIDPNLPDGLKHVERLSKLTQVYMSRGMKKEASMAAASQMLYAADQVSRLGSLSGSAYQEYLQTGNPDALKHSLEFIAQAHSYIPSGESFDVYVDPKTNRIVAQVTDLDGNKTSHEVTPQELPQIINATKDKSVYWKGVEQIADPAAARARASREATDARSQQTQNRQDARQKVGFEHTDANLAETRRLAAEKDAKKAEADAAKAADKKVNTAKFMPLVTKLKAAQKAQEESGSEDTRAVDIAASEAYDAIPDGVRNKDELFATRTGLQPTGFNYVPPEERTAAPPAADASVEPAAKPTWYSGGGAPAAPAQPGKTANFTPPPGARLDKRSGKYVAQMPNGDWAPVAGQ